GGLTPKDISYPLAMFQHTRAEKEDTRKLLHSLNKVIARRPLPSTVLDKSFEKFWPELKSQIDSIPEPEVVVKPERGVEDMLAEILDFTRAETNRRKADEEVLRSTAFLSRSVGSDWAKNLNVLWAEPLGSRMRE